MEAKRVELRQHLTVPPAPTDLAQLASVYMNPDLGKLTVEKSGSTVRIHAIAFSSAVGARDNDDGTTSLLPLEPGLDWLSLIVGNSAGTRTLTTGEGQHTYVFTEVPNAAAR